MRLAWERGGAVAWRLNRGVRQLTAPDGSRIDLSVDELGMLNCFLQSAGHVVGRNAMLNVLQSAHGPASSDPVHAAMLRLQRRAERTTPMTLPFKQKMTLLDLMIAVGGITDFADGNRATLLRTSEGSKQYSVRLRDLIKRGDVSANVELKPGDVLIIPQSWF